MLRPDRSHATFTRSQSSTDRAFPRAGTVVTGSFVPDPLTAIALMGIYVPMTSPHPTLAARVAHLRALGDLSMRALSDLAGLDSSHVRLIESGAREDPRSQTLAAIARATGSSLDWLITGGGAPPTADDVLAAVARARLAAQPAIDEPRPSQPAAA